MVNLARLEAAGLTEEKLKAFFSDPKPGSKAKELIDEINDEIRDGVSRNLKDYRIYWAIDRAFDTPFYQLAYTKLKGLLGKSTGKAVEDKAVLEQVKNWGLVHLLPDAIDDKGCACVDKVTGERKKSLNLPVFFDIEIPLVLAYLTIRWAKLFNDRNLVPLYKFEPIKFNKKNRLRGEVLTEVIGSVMANQFDYASVECQAILKTLMYGVALKFPREAWYVEKQEDESGKPKIVKEGLRFNIPHPTRTYYDLFSWLSTVNSNTGVKYGGYWEIVRYNDVLAKDDYWNKDKITFGAVGWFSGAGISDFFSTVYPCVLSWPKVDSGSITGASSNLDREAEAAYYGSGEANAATLQNQHFKCIVPKKYGIGTYEYPVWFRFVVGNGQTVHWAEPLAYTPMAYYGYDADQDRARHHSLPLEIIPFQDLSSNIFTQWIYSTKQNLMNPIFVNEDVVPREILNQLENVGEKLIRGKVFIPFSDTENIRTSVSVKEAFVAPQLTRHDTAQLATLIRGILDILDRVLVLSSQEIAQAASHEQTAEEIKTIQGTTSTRLDFTGSFIDRGIYATKRMLYDAWMAYGDDNVTAQISSDYAETEAEFKKMLKDIGLEVDDKEDDGESAQSQKRSIKGKKSAIAMETFTSSRDAANRIDNPGIAAAMSQIFTAVVNNPILMDRIGVEQMIDMLNDIMHTAGLPKERRFKVTPGTGMQAQSQELQDQIVKLAEQVKQAIDASAQQVTQTVLDETAKALQPLTQAIDQLAQKDQEQDQAIMAITQALQQTQQVIEQLAQPPPPQEMMIDDPNQPAVPLGI